MKNHYSYRFRFVPRFLTVFLIMSVAAAADIQDVWKTKYRTVEIGDLEIFYREAGDPSKPTILLLHGFPTSSHMFRDLIPLLSERYHLVAPDYPGFGYSSIPGIQEFDYTFENLTDVVDEFTTKLKLDNYILFMQDYGGPIGFRLATRHPEKVMGMIIQNANAYSAGVTDLFKDKVLSLWDGATLAEQRAVRELFELPVTRMQYLKGAENPEFVSPDAWYHAQWGMERPGNKDIQYALQANYGSNVELYPEWHAFFRKENPKTLVVWGKNDFIFGPKGAHAYKADIQNIEVHMLNAGHFALEEKADLIAKLIIEFFGQQEPGE